jgi:hypothetical protein
MIGVVLIPSHSIRGEYRLFKRSEAGNPGCQIPDCQSREHSVSWHIGPVQRRRTFGEHIRSNRVRDECLRTFLTALSTQ